MTLSKIRTEIRRMDPNCHGEDFKAAVCLIAATVVGATSDKVANFTGYPSKLVRGFSARLHESGVWRDGKTNADWFGKDGGIAFWCDVCVARGLMRRTKSTRSARKQQT